MESNMEQSFLPPKDVNKSRGHDVAPSPEMVADKLLAALASGNLEDLEQARKVFLAEPNIEPRASKPSVKPSGSRPADEETRLREEEDALRKAEFELEQRRAEVQAARKKAEEDA